MIAIVTSGVVFVGLIIALLTFVVAALLCALAGQGRWLIGMLIGAAVFGWLFYKVTGEVFT